MDVQIPDSLAVLTMFDAADLVHRVFDDATIEITPHDTDSTQMHMQVTVPRVMQDKSMVNFVMTLTFGQLDECNGDASDIAKVAIEFVTNGLLNSEEPFYRTFSQQNWDNQ